MRRETTVVAVSLLIYPFSHYFASARPMYLSISGHSVLRG